jgi:hypothetical protein
MVSYTLGCMRFLEYMGFVLVVFPLKCAWLHHSTSILAQLVHVLVCCNVCCVYSTPRTLPMIARTSYFLSCYWIFAQTIGAFNYGLDSTVSVSIVNTFSEQLVLNDHTI